MGASLMDTHGEELLENNESYLTQGRFFHMLDTITIRLGVPLSQFLRYMWREKPP